MNFSNIRKRKSNIYLNGQFYADTKTVIYYLQPYRLFPEENKLKPPYQNDSGGFVNL